VSFIDRNLRQDVTYWAPTSAPNRYGQEGFEAPVKLRGRWEEHETQVRNAQGDIVTSTTRVFLNQKVAIQGRLVLGDLTGSATPPEDSREIQGFEVSPDLRSLAEQNQAYL